MLVVLPHRISLTSLAPTSLFWIFLENEHPKVPKGSHHGATEKIPAADDEEVIWDACHHNVLAQLPLR